MLNLFCKLSEKNDIFAAIIPTAMDNQLEQTTYKGERVRLCTDGKYRWTWPMNMYKNPLVLLTVLKIFGIIFGVAMVLMFIGPAFRGEWSAVLEGLKIWAIILGVFLVITLLAYWIVAALYGGKYIVHFTMDEKGLLHDQVPMQKKKAEKMGCLIALAGIFAKRPSVAGAGFMTAAHTKTSSDFSRVRRIKAYPRLHSIKVNEGLSKNQVYTHPEDFSFVLDYIQSHCPKCSKK